MLRVRIAPHCSALLKARTTTGGQSIATLAAYVVVGRQKARKDLFPSSLPFFNEVENLPENVKVAPMKAGGILEVLLVNAKDIRHTHLVGSSEYYVVVECGNREHRTKVSSGKHENACWNEKFSFELPSSDWKNITHIKFRIMETKFRNNESVGATAIHLGGIISEGYERGCLEVKPAPYNVVLEDDTYKGEIKIGFKFFTKEEIVLMEERECITDEKQPRKSTIYGKVLNLWRIVWLKLVCLFGQKISYSERKKQ